MKRKGFTLIELLAVIVILAVLMVIAVPKILDVIENSRQSAAKSSTELYIDAVNKNNSLSEVNDDYTKINDGTVNIAKINIKLKGNGPSSGEVTINNSKVKEAKLCINDYSVYYDGNKTEINGDFCNGDFELDKSELCDYKIGQEWTFDYVEDAESNGYEQVFNVPCEATYKLETWGAQGGYATSSTEARGGYGAYSVGVVVLNNAETLYINIGGEGKANLSFLSSISGGYNGGGGSLSTSATKWGSGGGTTHIATVSGLLSNLEEYKGSYSDITKTYNSSEILIVSGAGGGAGNNGSTYNKGGSAGGIKGNSGKGSSYGTGGTQLSGGSGAGSNIINGNFGLGGGSIENQASGGGSGWYGGGTGYGLGSSAGGGSSFIGSSRLISYSDVTKATYCYNCEESNLEQTKTISTTNVSEIAVSQYAKQGNGYAKITLISFN